MSTNVRLSARPILGGILAAVGISYGALLAATYLQTTAPSALGPDLGGLGQLLFPEKAISPMERRLEASNTPLGTGPLIREPIVAMPPSAAPALSFALASGTKPLDEPLSDVELAEREGERQALLDWIRSGASQVAYERDDHSLAHVPADIPITADFLVREGSAGGESPSRRVRIRSLINERCVSCHQEDGDDTARLIPFDDYQSIALYLRPDVPPSGGRGWLLAALFSLFPLAAIAGPAFACTSHPRPLRRGTLVVSSVALLGLCACWIAGSIAAPVLFACAAAAAIGVQLQLLASAVSLLGVQRAVKCASPG